MDIRFAPHHTRGWYDPLAESQEFTGCCFAWSAVLAAVLVARASRRLREEGREAAVAVPTVVVATVEQKDVEVASEWVGTTTGNVNAQIYPKIQGYLMKQNYTRRQPREGRRPAVRDRRSPVPGGVRPGEGSARARAGDPGQGAAGRDALHAARRGRRGEPDGARHGGAGARRGRRERGGREGHARERAAQPRVDQGAGRRSTASRESPTRRSAIW